MTTGVVDIKIFGPPVASSELPPGGFQVGPGNNPIGVNPVPGSPVGGQPVGATPVGGTPVGGSPAGGTPWPMTLVDGIYRPASSNGLPLLVPPGCEADGYRELLVHERDTNWISQYTQFLMFMGMVDQNLQFYDGNDYYAIFSLLSEVRALLPNGFYICPTTVAIPSGAVSAITLPSNSSIFMGTNSDYIIPASPGFTVSSYSSSYGQTSFTLTTSLTAGSASFDLAQVGFLPVREYSNQLYLLAGGTSPNTYTDDNVYTSIPTTPVAVYTSYQLSQVYTVPAEGAITIEYGISATL